MLKEIEKNKKKIPVRDSVPEKPKSPLREHNERKNIKSSDDDDGIRPGGRRIK